MTTCIFDGMFSTDGDDPRNWVDIKMPKDGDTMHVRGKLMSWTRAPKYLRMLVCNRDAEIGKAVALPGRAGT